MAYLIGTDEAGYGPNLGPLVISASVWRVPSLQQDDLYRELGDGVRRPQKKADDDERMVIGDSKDLYKPGKGLAGLEQGVLPCLAAIKQKPRSWRKIWSGIAKEDSKSLTELPWYQNFNNRLPVELSAAQIRDKASRFLASCDAAGCTLKQIKSRVVCPPRFNELCEQHGNKASALSHTTLSLVRSILDELPDDQPAFVLCDKHGGRNKYAALLQDVFPDFLATIHAEGRTESVYEFGPRNGSRRFVFRAKADETFLPSALASMVSKYLRELAMMAFNAFWTSEIDDLQPTAGYPMDAKRFKRDIERRQKSLGIDDKLIWRCR